MYIFTDQALSFSLCLLLLLFQAFGHLVGSPLSLFMSGDVLKQGRGHLQDAQGKLLSQGHSSCGAEMAMWGEEGLCRAWLPGS